MGRGVQRLPAERRVIFQPCYSWRALEAGGHACSSGAAALQGCGSSPLGPNSWIVLV